HAALRIDRDGVRHAELSRTITFRSPRLDELAVFRELDDAVVDVAVGDEDVAALADRDIAGAGEGRFRLSGDTRGAESHHDLAVACHLQNLLALAVRGAPIGEPEKSLAIDAEAMRPHDQAVAPLLDDVSGRCELDEIRTGATDADDRVAVRIDVDAG